MHEGSSVMTHKLKVGAGLVAVVAALGVGSAVLQKRAVAAANGTQAPRFEVDPLWPKPLPNHWVLGNDHRRVGGRAGSHLDHSSRGFARSEGNVRQLQSSGARSAARPRRRCWNSTGGQPDRHWGGPGKGYDWPDFEPRHHGRLQRQRLDRRQRPRHASGTPRGRKPARARRRKTSQRLAPITTIRS